jgi:hypothetical protein
MSTLKEQLYDELKLALALRLDGVYFRPGIIDDLFARTPIHTKVQTKITRELVERLDYYVPVNFTLPHGQEINAIGSKISLYSIEKEGDSFYIAERGEKLYPISFNDSAPDFYNKNAADGTPMREIGNWSSGSSPDKSVIFCYSEECSAKEKGETCLFCSFSRTRIKEFESEAVPFRTPQQIGETALAAYREGFSHLTITGGFVPERREVEYYLDVAEAIQDYLSVEDFNGTACIGAPLDFSVIDKYKDAGFRTIAFNTEVWGKEWFDVINPVKVSSCGGFDNWVKAIEYAIKVFGKGKVRSNFVVGLQPKDRLFEGIEYLASIGVVTVPSPFFPSPVSPLAGFRSPTLEWQWDAQLKVTSILQKYGRTYQELFDGAPSRFLAHEIYQFEDGTHPAYAQFEERASA